MSRFPAARCALLAALLTASTFLDAGAVQLRLYPGFAEVRTPISSRSTRLTVTLPQDVWAAVIPGSLDLEGLPYASALRTVQPGWLAALEGKKITLRENGKRQVVTLIRARDLLIRDAAGEYRTVSAGQLSFASLPPLDSASGQTVSFGLNAPGRGTLSYLTRAVSWTPRYTLNVSGSSAVLRALADIRNGTGEAVAVSATELFAGDVSVGGGSAGQGQVMEGAASTSGSMALPSIPLGNRVVTLAGVGGLYRYGLTQRYTLPAASTYTLPFLTPKLSGFQRFASLNTYFSTGNSAGTFNRSYRFRADQNLPGGQVTVREAGRIVGQVGVPETAKGERVEFSLGRDPDVRYLRRVETLSTSKNGGRYRVTYTFRNSRVQAVRAELSEGIGGKSVVLEGSPPQNGNQATATLQLTVPAGGEVSRSFTVTVERY